MAVETTRPPLEAPRYTTLEGTEPTSPHSRGIQVRGLDIEEHSIPFSCRRQITSPHNYISFPSADR